MIHYRHEFIYHSSSRSNGYGFFGLHTICCSCGRMCRLQTMVFEHKSILYFCITTYCLAVNVFLHIEVCKPCNYAQECIWRFVLLSPMHCSRVATGPFHQLQFRALCSGLVRVAHKACQSDSLHFHCPRRTNSYKKDNVKTITMVVERSLYSLFNSVVGLC